MSYLPKKVDLTLSKSVAPIDGHIYAYMGVYVEIYNLDLTPHRYIYRSNYLLTASFLPKKYRLCIYAYVHIYMYT